MTKTAGAYVAVPLAPADAPELLGALGRLGFCGVNVTAPHKTLALKLADDARPSARQIGAANVLSYKDGSIIADNTDAEGFERALVAASADLAWPAVVIGAGGAARAVVYALGRLGVERLRIVCRSEADGDSLAELFRTLAPRATVDRLDWSRLQDSVDGAGLVVNTTPLGSADRPELTVDFASTRSNALASDIVYAPLETSFLRAAREGGRATLNGLHMLVGQARPSFSAFFDVPAPEDPDAVSALTRLLEARA